MPYVIQHPNQTYLVKKDAWSTEWSDKINDARIYPSLRATTVSTKTLNDGYNKPLSLEVEIIEVDIVPVKS